MQVFGVESLYCRENATKKVSFRRLVCNTHLSLVPFYASKGTSLFGYAFHSPITFLYKSRPFSVSRYVCSGLLGEPGKDMVT